MSFKLNPLLALVPYMSQEPESEKYFRHIWVRRDLVETLERTREVIPLVSDNPDLKSFAVPFEIMTGRGDRKDHLSRQHFLLQMDPAIISGLVSGALPA